MKLGAIFPQTEIGSDPADMRAWAAAVESLGYDYIQLYDHIVGAHPERPGGWHGPYTIQTPFHEIMTTLAYIAAHTRTVHLLTGIVILPQRGTALVAKQAATLDILSEGRLWLGVGAGWNAVEMQAAGYDFGTRGRRMTEQVQVLQQLWTQARVSFAGEFHTLDDVGLNPMPRQRPIPLWFGGGSAPAFRRMAQYGVGWVANAADPATRGAEAVAGLRAALADAERDPAEFLISVPLSVVRLAPDEWPAYIDAWRDLGATHIAALTMGAGYTPQEHIAALARFREAWPA